MIETNQAEYLAIQRSRAVGSSLNNQPYSSDQLLPARFKLSDLHQTWLWFYSTAEENRSPVLRDGRI